MAAANTIPIPQSAEDIAPSWVQQVLQRDLPGVIITDVDVKGSISADEGHLTDIIAFDAVGTRNAASQRYSLVAKLTAFSRWLAMFTGYTNDDDAKIRGKKIQIKAEATEVEFYSSMVPKLLSVRAEIQSKVTKGKAKGKDDKGEGTHSSPLPKCYFAATDPTSTVSVRVMENLKSQGFAIKANRQPLNREEMMLTVGALARIHGLSHRLEHLSGTSLSKKFTGPPFELDDIVIECQRNVMMFTTAFPDQADLGARLKKINAKTDLCDVMEKSPRLKVLNHGDCWVNNIMIKYEGEVPVEVKLVDWQGVTYMPPTCDLAFLFLCSVSWDTFHNHRGAILAHYHQELMKTLGSEESLGLHSYTLAELKADFRTDCLYGLVQRITHMPALPPDQDLLNMVQEIKEWGAI